MSNVTFTDGNLDEVIAGVAAAFNRPNRVNIDLIPDSMRQAVVENFANESGNGQAWRPLAKETVEEREFLGFPGTNPILFRTGDLFETATNPNDADHIEEINFDSEGFSVTVGTRDDRAGRLNAVREFMVADEAQQNNIADSVEAYFESLFI